jgi:hypothetical protein
MVELCLCQCFGMTKYNVITPHDVTRNGQKLFNFDWNSCIY